MMETMMESLAFINHVSIAKNHLGAARRLILDMEEGRPPTEARNDVIDAYWHLERALTLLKEAPEEDRGSR